MKVYALFIFVFFAVAGYSQNSINNYKYVLVPEKFDFLREDNQYGLNTIAKLMLADKGFVAFLGNEQLPPELAVNKCNALKAEVVQKKGLFVTNLTLLLKDCQGNVIFKSKEGKSREKEYHVAYNEALRDAFTSLKDVAYKYDSTALPQTAQVAATPAPQPLPAQATAPAPAATPEITGTLYAQPTPNGYQLVDTTPKKIITLLKTSLSDYFIAEAGATNGIVFKKEGVWVFEYYKDNKLVSQKLEIKF
jgi:hypothetical protein